MFTINVVLFGIGILALIVQIVVTTKKEWTTLLFYAAVAALLWQLFANFPWFGEIVIGILDFILKLIPWLIGAFLIFFVVMVPITVNAYWEHNAPMETYLLIREGKFDEAEEFLMARAKKHRRSKEKLAVIQRQLELVRKLKEKGAEPETEETPTKELPPQFVQEFFSGCPTIPVVDSKDGSEESAQSEPITPQDQD